MNPGNPIMNKRIRLIAFAFVAIVGGYGFLAQGKFLVPQVRQGPVHGPVVVELFTSQGCSSCPPADALIAKLAREHGVIAISRPVTYWDRLGWRDTLAREGNTDLQRSYVARGIGGEVFTPQVVVSGQASAVGSDERSIRGLIADASRGATASITMKPGALSLDGVSGTASDVKIVTLRRNVPVRIGSGENGGHNIIYTNVVARELVIGTWRGSAQQFALPASRMAAAGGEMTAVIVQQRGNGPILGALMLP